MFLVQFKKYFNYSSFIIRIYLYTCFNFLIFSILANSWFLLMASNSDKNMLPSKFFSSLIAVSMFILIISSWFLFRLDNSVIPTSVYNLIPVNDGTEQIKPTLHASITSPNAIEQEQPLKTLDRRKACDSNQAILRVYMYDLPPVFHFGLLGWRGNPNQTWPNVSDPNQIPRYPGGLNLQHSIEYWLTLDLLSSNTPNVKRPCSAIRVNNSNEADIVFVPFFSSLSYNRHSKVDLEVKVSVDRMLQDKLVEFLKGRDEWMRLGGKDHLIIAHHPNSMLVARTKLGSAMFVLADFGRYPIEIANLEKDIIAPYKHIVRSIAGGNSAPFEMRSILIYFQGAIYRKDVCCFSSYLQELQLFLVAIISEYLFDNLALLDSFWFYSKNAPFYFFFHNELQKKKKSVFESIFMVFIY